MLSENEKEKIEQAIRENMNMLEELLNESLENVIDAIEIKDEDALFYAREVFFKG